MPNQNGRNPQYHDEPRSVHEAYPARTEFERDRYRDMERPEEWQRGRSFSQGSDQFAERDRSAYGGVYDRRPNTGYGYDDGGIDDRTGSRPYDRQSGSQSGQGYVGSPYRDRQNRDYQSRPQLQRGPHHGKGPRNFQRSDERIKEMINEALTDHDDLDATFIEVYVKNGEVTLTGHVDDRRAKRMAEDTVERIAGVKDVQNQLKIDTGHEVSPSSEKKHRAS